MKKFALVFVALLSTAAFAQTYSQSDQTNIGIPGQWGCRLNDYVCQGVPMTSGDTWTITDDSSRLYPNRQFVWDQVVQGAIDEVIVQPSNFGDGAFSFTFSLSDGRTGTVRGIFVLHVVGRAKYAAVEGSWVTFN